MDQSSKMVHSTSDFLHHPWCIKNFPWLLSFQIKRHAIWDVSKKKKPTGTYNPLVHTPKNHCSQNEHNNGILCQKTFLSSLNSQRVNSRDCELPQSMDIDTSWYPTLMLFWPASPILMLFFFFKKNGSCWERILPFFSLDFLRRLK